EAVRLELAPVRLLIGKGQNLSEAGELSLHPDLLEQDGEPVAGLQVAVEIEIPLQDVVHPVGKRAVGSGAADGRLERTVELSPDRTHALFTLEGAEDGGPGVVAALQPHFAASGELELERRHRPV